jgi:hypothetical protein
MSKENIVLLESENPPSESREASLYNEDLAPSLNTKEHAEPGTMLPYGSA